MVDTLGRGYLPQLLQLILDPVFANTLGAALPSIAIYLLMIMILIFKPKGLFPAYG